MSGTAVGLMFLAWLVSVLAGLRFPRIWLAAFLVATVAGLVAAFPVLTGAPAWTWRSGFALGGAPVFLRLDALSALFLVLALVVSAACSVYSLTYWAARKHPLSARSGRVWLSLLGLSMVCVVLCSDGLHFLIAWESFAISAYFLITLDGGSVEARKAGRVYLIASHAGTLALFAFFTLIAVRTGSWILGPMHDRAELAPLFWLALFGFGVKAGLFPLHVWLPSAHARSPSHVSAIMSGVALKMGIYGIIRFSGWLPQPAGADWALVVIGGASAVLGVAFALGQHDLKRLLAYHSVENIGIILLGLGAALLARRTGENLWGDLALAGALLHVWNHGLFKSLLFLGAGSVVHSTGTREMSRLGGLWRAMPWTAGLFAFGAVAICGLPPLNGFVSEWLVYLGYSLPLSTRAVSAGAAVPAVIALAITGAMALACFVKACGVVFLGEPRSAAAAKGHECGWTMRLPMLVLAAACAYIALFPATVWPLVARAVTVWDGHATPLPVPSGLDYLQRLQLWVAVSLLVAVAAFVGLVRHRGVARRPVWDCGYASPTARMQYTAGSFAMTLVGWFRWVLRPRSRLRRPEGYFPADAEFDQHTPETVLEQVVEPVGALVLRGSSLVRRLQHGRVQFYLLYLLMAFVLVAVVIIAGGGR